MRQDVTLTHNDSGKFEDRWVHLKANPLSNCVFIRGIENYVVRTQHPRWTRERLADEGDGLAIFKNAVDYVMKEL
ncbi:MAG: phosphoribosylformylglycinamidine synthase subunit PurQ [Actinobacteria bacterium]|nr:phosphoribosylformylglycinamidine synthase subunit PurQ [Actinomycetota bacterium]